MAGITGYASYLPAIRIRAEEFKKAWGSAGGGFKEKAVADFDEDTVTMGYEAARAVLRKKQVDPKDISFIALASTNYPYAEKTSGSTIAAMIGAPSSCLTSEHGNSTLAGTEALLEAWRHSLDNPGSVSLVIVSDAPRGPVNESWENPLGAGAVALTLGGGDVICEIEDYASCVAEYIGERFRPEGATEIRELGIASYSRKAVEEVMAGAVRGLLKKTGLDPAGFSHLALDQKNSRQPAATGSRLGFTPEQQKTGFTFPLTGDTGAASPFISLCAVLDAAREGDRVLLVSYGGGSASHAISLRATAGIGNFKGGPAGRAAPRYIDYMTYLKLKRVVL